MDKNNFGKPRKNRVIASKEQRKNYLIVCEGARTEPGYFKEIIAKFDNPKMADVQIEGTGCNTDSLVKLAIRYKENSQNNIDEVWVVFDRDSFPVVNFNDALNIARAEGFKLAWSNEAFEIWFLLHFNLIVNAKSRTDYGKDIEKWVNKHPDFKRKPFVYAKNLPNIYELLQKYGNEAQAIKWAKQLEINHIDVGTSPFKANPCTLVYKLVEELNKYKT